LVECLNNHDCHTAEAKACEHKERLTKEIALSVPSYKQGQAKAKGKTDGVQD